MPIIGEISRRPRSQKGLYDYLIWAACGRCGKERWVRLYKGESRNKLCQFCSQKGIWKPAAKHKMNDGQGYILVKLHPSDPFYCMAGKAGYVMEHRLIMAKRLGRPLLKSEQVHHIDGIKNHNDNNNLQLVSRADHNLKTRLCDTCPLKQEIRIIRLQNKLLLEQVRELNLKMMERKEMFR